MLCQNCGVDNKGDAKFCESCGTNLQMVDESFEPENKLPEEKIWRDPKLLTAVAVTFVFILLMWLGVSAYESNENVPNTSGYTSTPQKAKPKEPAMCIS